MYSGPVRDMGPAPAGGGYRNGPVPGGIPACFRWTGPPGTGPLWMFFLIELFYFLPEADKKRRLRDNYFSIIFSLRPPLPAIRRHPPIASAFPKGSTIFCIICSLALSVKSEHPQKR